jgi:hypothetical protein
MTTLRVVTLDIFVLVALAGCAPAVDQDGAAEDTGDSEMALVTDNAMVPNGLNPNGLYSNGLNPNGLAPNALNPNALDPKALSAIKDPGSAGTLSRMLLKYTVGCAFTTSQSFSFSWTDSKKVVHNETYQGLLGIAPAWATGPLDLNGQQMVSACLAGRTNYYGVQVTISMRSLQDPLHTLVNSSEVTAYYEVEGGFWGNLFAATPYLRACYTTSNVANSRSYKRDCAAGHLNADGTISPCGMIQILGPCESYCKTLNGAGQYYPDCTDPVYGTFAYMVTTALQ